MVARHWGEKKIENYYLIGIEFPFYNSKQLQRWMVIMYNIMNVFNITKLYTYIMCFSIIKIKLKKRFADRKFENDVLLFHKLQLGHWLY